MRTIIAVLLSVPLQVLAWCGPFQMSGWVDNVKPTLNSNIGDPNGPALLDSRPPYTPAATSWSFGTQLPNDTTAHITDIVFQSKYVNYFPGQPSPVPYGTRSSFLWIQGLISVADHMGGQVHFRTPLRVPPGFRFTAAFFNHSPEEQNMIAILTGYLTDPTCP